MSIKFDLVESLNICMAFTIHVKGVCICCCLHPVAGVTSEAGNAYSSGTPGSASQT